MRTRTKSRPSRQPFFTSSDMMRSASSRESAARYTRAVVSASKPSAMEVTLAVIGIDTPSSRSG